METTTTQTALKWGAIAGVISIVSSLVNYLTDAQIQGGALQWGVMAFGFVVMAAVLWLAMGEFKTNNGGFMTYGQGLGIGTLMGAISGVVSAVFNYVYVTFIDTTFTGRMMEFQTQKMEEQGLDPAAIEKGMEYGKMFSSPGFMFVLIIFTSVLFYFLFSLVVAAIQRKDKPVF